MAAIRRLSNPPIVEALLDFRFNVPEGVGQKQIDILKRDLEIALPKSELRHTFQATFNLQPKRTDAGAVERTVEGVVLRSNDDRKAVIVKRNGLTVSHVRSYQAWEDLVGDAQHIFSRYCEFFA